MILQRALKKVPDWCEDEDWRLPMNIDQYENSNVNIYLLMERVTTLTG
jgi:hypothetical protein